ncbi:hypothetical protein CORC01_01510 [Colletotrichum orchidophilum]|uniref:Uncharacterized protein n=1 Tax=Colletotrichum orchidophilum TaxID=1209926 RepID=A0A1G4BPB9_9PEZI|nr:uncharacterized protein CORC01_01510 [Colletotrichum orchidophilum]OHF03126.1 hypothetical protein CORC01_01510 [Colletotrichum orchidophilum]
MPISPLASGSPLLSTLSVLLLVVSVVLGGAIAAPTTTAPTTTYRGKGGRITPPTPDRAYEAPLLVGVTPAPDPTRVSQRLLRARQGDPRPSDGRTNFIAWYSQSGSWVSATCPSDNYFAADDSFGVCCPRNNPYCEMATSCGGPFNNYAIGPTGQADCGPSNTCDTITMLQTQGSTDARRIIFCIAMSELYVLPMTWYRVTNPLPEASVATVTVTLSTTVTATAQAGNSTGGQPGSPSQSPPAKMALVIAAMISFLALVLP